jgi:hypothetical protein
MMMSEWAVIPEPWITKLADLPEFSMGVTVVDVTLKDGKLYEDIVTCGGAYDKANTPFRWDDVDKLEVKPENVGGGVR